MKRLVSKKTTLLNFQDIPADKMFELYQANPHFDCRCTVCEK